MKFLNGFKATKTLLLAAVSSTCFLLAVGTGVLASGTPDSRSYFEIRYPDLSRLKEDCSNDDGPCTDEAVALAAAVQSMEAAKAAAKEAYDAWINCLDANGGGPNPNPGSPLANTVSILESVK